MFQSTQIWRVILATFLTWIILLLISLRMRTSKNLKRYWFLHVLVLAILVVMMLTSYNLKITINDKDLHFQFGPGVIEKTIALEDITDCKVVKNKRRYGFGIRKIKSWRLYNVSGLDAVELTLSWTDKVIRVGTQEPAKICEVLDK